MVVEFIKTEFICQERNADNQSGLGLTSILGRRYNFVLLLKTIWRDEIPGRLCSQSLRIRVLPIMLAVSLSVLFPVHRFYPAAKEKSLERPAETRPKRILLIGASIGKGWNISALPERIVSHDYVFEYVYSGGFDKSRKLQEVLSRVQNRADAIFLKECAAYFPGDFPSYQRLMKKWIADCLDAGVIPIPATVVPVTRLHSFKKFGIDILKLRNPFRMGIPFRQRRQRAIQEYNDWLRAYCRENGLAVLDLEKALSKGGKNRYLRSRFAKIDGLHLNKKGYQVLDAQVPPVLGKVDWTGLAKLPGKKDRAEQ